MARPITLCTGQWADLPLEILCQKARDFGYDGLELACWGDHFEVQKALQDLDYIPHKRELLLKYGMKVFSLSNHLVGQAIYDRIDQRHKDILPPHVWGDGDPEGVRQRAAREMIDTARAAKAFGVDIVNCFSGSSIWHLLYMFPPTPMSMIDAGFEDFARRWRPIFDEFQKLGVRYALEVHPTEIAFDIVSTERALQAVDYHPAFGFNFDPSHLGYQGVDYIEFIHRFGDRIHHVHIKDAWWADTPRLAGVFGGHLAFGDPRRCWDFRSPGRGKIDFEAVLRALNAVGYQGPLSVEWEDSGMEREFGAREGCAFVRRLDFMPSQVAFDAAIGKQA